MFLEDAFRPRKIFGEALERDSIQQANSSLDTWDIKTSPRFPGILIRKDGLVLGRWEEEG